ncbi:hypothetical protein ILUMI_19085 [Ignelater luminosus]|uniref:Uncharacterized protein n=1 Tax=Ignelater luminosus TaxID=2038154 RepID=A0A8K0CMC7_IGNLU|nr:hypothetical protein ILUMI_19085 [Ignelater luminosus]
MKERRQYGAERNPPVQEQKQRLRWEDLNSAFQETNLHEWWQEHVQDDLIIQLKGFQERDSPWKIKSILSLAINIKCYEPVRGSHQSTIHSIRRFRVPAEIHIKQKKKNSELHKEHKAFSVGYYFHYSHDGSISKYKRHRGPDYRRWFTKKLRQIAEDV